MDIITRIILALLFSSALAGLAAWRRALTKWALVLAWSLSVIIFLCGGFPAFFALASTFIFTILAGKISGKRREAIEKQLHSKTGCRDAVQVFCNVFVGTLMIFFGTVLHRKGFILGFAGAMAASLADSMASELGVLSRQQPRDILSWKPVSKGLSGGVTLLGFLASFLGAFLIALVFTLCSKDFSVISLIDITLAGFFAALCDSIFGSAFQVKYRCPICNQLTEKTQHCGTPGIPERGFPFITNDTVNLINNIIGAISALLLFSLHS